MPATLHPRFSILAFALLAAAGTAQVRVSLEGRRPSELEQQVLRLAEPSSAPAAMAALFATGAPAVPLLVAAAQRDDASSLAALRVLGELGGTARAAWPALQRLTRSSPRLAAAAAHAAASIGERDSVLFADWCGHRVVEVDAEGKLLREVACTDAKSVQPLADDHLLIACYNANCVCEIDWQGRVVDSWPWQGPMQARRLPDGTMLVAAYQGREGVHVATDGKVLVRLPGLIRMVRQEWNGDLLFLRDDDGALVRVSPTGKVLHERRLARRGLDFDVGHDGIRVVYPNGVVQIRGEGLERDLGFGKGIETVSVAGLRDGRCLLGERGRLTMRTATGTVQWEFAARYPDSIVARLLVEQH
jgi:hypothetical protein